GCAGDRALPSRSLGRHRPRRPAATEAAGPRALAMPNQERIRRLGETEALRRDLLHRIGAKRNSVVIAYLTSTRQGAIDHIFDGDVEIIERHVQAARGMGARNLDL